MFTKRHPSEARPNGRSAPTGSIKGKTPPNSGHRVPGKGRSAPRGMTGGKSPASRNKPTGGKGVKSSRGGEYGGGSY